MPPRTRGTKGTKILKENLVAVDKTKSKTVGKVTKPPRKALADKTNSASDDNTSTEIKKKVDQKHAVFTGIENMARPRRERRLPTRYVENIVLNNLSSSKIELDNADADSKTTKHQASAKVNTSVESPFKTPQKSLENSLVANRPKRISRLPSKFDDHSVSPSKFIPVQPCHASTPILESKSSKVTEKAVRNKEKKDLKLEVTKTSRKAPQKRSIEESPEASADSNNNAKRRLIRHKNTKSETRSRKDKASPKKTKNLPKKVTEKSFSFRVLEDKKKSSQNEENDLDVYEFTYDPNEEPPPAKKKRKKAVKKKPAQPKTVVFKSNYDQNVAKALAALKNVVAKKPDKPKVKSAQEIVNTKVAPNEMNNKRNAVQKLPQDRTEVPKQIAQNVNRQALPLINTQVTNESAQNVPKITIETAPTPANITNVIEERNYNSVRVEDIAADFGVDDYNDINYSPVNSPQRRKTPSADNQIKQSVHNNDPLNLRGDLSFFDDNPVASSSMNMSVRHPQASPWRVEFGNLPIKWQVNTYVKPNMTPAVESSFINFEDNKKKHVYTNMIGPDDCAPEAVPNQSNLKQTSIISFIREVVERSAQKKKRARSVTPTKANTLFDDLPKGASTGNNAGDKTPKKTGKPADKSSKKSNENVSNSSDPLQDKENSSDKENKKKKANTATKDKDGTFFGFDDSEDQENVSPVKVDNPKVRALRPRARAVLQEINSMSGPMRALPLAAKSKIATSSDAVNKVYEELKSAADAPVFPEKSSMQTRSGEIPEKSHEVTNVDEVTCDMDMNEDSLSVHLFEDIEVVHHLKPTRKSYGKAKKVTFRQHSTSSETLGEDHEHEQVSSEEDDLADLTFTMPSVQPQKKAKKKKMTKKQKMSKKEEKALDEWAAGFNSMCEEIEDVPLIVE